MGDAPPFLPEAFCRQVEYILLLAECPHSLPIAGTDRPEVKELGNGGPAQVLGGGQ